MADQPKTENKIRKKRIIADLKIKNPFIQQKAIQPKNMKTLYNEINENI